MLSIPKPNGDFHLPAPDEPLTHREVQALVDQGRAMKSEHTTFLVRFALRELRDLINLDHVLRVGAHRHMGDYA